MFSVQCSVFNVQCSVFSVQCSVFSVQCSVFSVQCSVFSVQCSHEKIFEKVFEISNIIEKHYIFILLHHSGLFHQFCVQHLHVFVSVG